MYVILCVIFLCNFMTQSINASSLPDEQEGHHRNVRALCLSSGLINDIHYPDAEALQNRHYTLSTWASFFGASHENPKKILFIPDAKVVTENELDNIPTDGWPKGWTNLMSRMDGLLRDYGVNLIPYENSQPSNVLKQVDGVFVFGGNTFQLQDRLHVTGLVDELMTAVLKHELPYLGGSAGTNVATKTIRTTNDTLITAPFEYDGMGILPFAVNVHYFSGPTYYKNASGDFIEYSGETRDERMQQFLMANQTHPYVVLLPEGTAIQRENNLLTILGARTLDVATYDFATEKYCKTAMTSDELTRYVFALSDA